MKYYENTIAQERVSGAKERLKQAYEDWSNNVDWDISITLTFTCDIRKENATAIAAIYWNKVDGVFYTQNDIRRRGIRVQRICYLEGWAGVRNWHYHAAVKMPVSFETTAGNPHDRKMQFGELLLNTWMYFYQAGRHSMVRPIYDRQGWLGYISKDAVREDCGVCTTTTHISDDSDMM